MGTVEICRWRSSVLARRIWTSSSCSWWTLPGHSHRRPGSSEAWAAGPGIACARRQIALALPRRQSDDNASTVVSSVLSRRWRKLAMHNLSRRSTIRDLLLLASGSRLASASRCVAAEDVPLAIKGYDPVAYFTDGKPTHGLPEIEYEWDEHRYRFA